MASRIVLLLCTLCVGANAFDHPESTAMHRDFRRPQISRLRGGQSVVAFKTPAESCTQAENTGTLFASQSHAKQFWNAVFAGCYIGFGGLLAITVGGNIPGIKSSNPGLQKLIFGMFGLPFGLFMNVMTGGQLFTGNTALVTSAFFAKRVSMAQMVLNWSLVYIGNLVGSLLVAFMAFHSGVLGDGAGIMAIAATKAALPLGQTFVRAIMCNWMVCLALWMQGAAHDVAGKAMAIFLPITLFTAIGFEHSVANMMLIPLGMMHGAPVTTLDAVRNIIPVSIGNLVAGVLCVAAPFHFLWSSSAATNLPKAQPEA